MPDSLIFKISDEKIPQSDNPVIPLHERSFAADQGTPSPHPPRQGIQVAIGCHVKEEVKQARDQKVAQSPSRHAQQQSDGKSPDHQAGQVGLVPRDRRQEQGRLVCRVGCGGQDDRRVDMRPPLRAP